MIMGRFKKFSRSLAIGVAAVAAAWSLPVAAQQANSFVTDSQTVGSWSVRCYRSGPFTCDMTQVDVDRARNALIASVAISYDPKSDSYLGRFLVPLGVSFEQGLAIEIGSFSAQNIKFRVCARDGCLVISPLPPQMVQAMMAAGSTRGSMKATTIDGRKFEIPILLDGFSDSLDLLKKKTAEKLAAKK
ncbi:MAG TPA: invasion associated locus B family protein [Rhizomicrobium sp.]|nr:invasion associated locus B family protein [Rhizomicrobium sp.]